MKPICILSLMLVSALVIVGGEGSRVITRFNSHGSAEETDEEKWTDISAKKLDTQKEEHDEETKLNHVHAVHEHPAEVHVAHFEKSVPEVDFRSAQIEDINLGGVKYPEAKGSAASVLTVVGLGFVAFIAIIGVIRYRATKNHANGGDAANANMGGDDYHWVDELNIIVNPMEEQSSTGNDEDQELPLRDDFSEDSEMSDREMDLEAGDMEDLSSDDEDVMPGVTIATAAGVKELRSCRGLEWDDSTI